MSETDPSKKKLTVFLTPNAMKRFRQKFKDEGYTVLEECPMPIADDKIGKAKHEAEQLAMRRLEEKERPKTYSEKMWQEAFVDGFTAGAAVHANLPQGRKLYEQAKKKWYGLPSAKILPKIG